MSVQAAEQPMADERKEFPFQIRCTHSWLDRVKGAADKLGMSAASYIRMAVTQRMDADDVPHPKPPRPKK